MIYCEIISVFIWTLIGTVTAVPEHLLCCPPGKSTFRNRSCWDEKSNINNPLPLTCPFAVFLEKFFNLTITDSGQVFLINPLLTEPNEIQPGEICFANDSNTNKNLVVLCIDEEEDGTVVAYCMLVSAVFLLLTAVIYAALPEVRDLQGKSIINFCASMGIGLAIFADSKLVSHSNKTLCAIRGFTTYFFLMASFFWTNAISVQVLLSLRRPVVSNYSWKEFSWYALYAWGCPTVLTLCTAIVNFHPGDHKKPGIGLNTCWFYNTRQQWYYMYSVLTILIIANICIFIYISVQLWRVSFSSQSKQLRYKFVMSFRLFIVMGITWIFEMISSLTEKGIVWFIIDVFNTLQGPLIFILLVVLRKRVVKALLRRGCLSCVARPVERYLAVKEDDEEGVMQHTIDVTMNERNGTERNGTERN